MLHMQICEFRCSQFILRTSNDSQVRVAGSTSTVVLSAWGIRLGPAARASFCPCCLCWTRLVGVWAWPRSATAAEAPPRFCSSAAEERNGRANRLAVFSLAVQSVQSIVWRTVLMLTSASSLMCKPEGTGRERNLLSVRLPTSGKILVGARKITGQHSAVKLPTHGKQQ